MKRRESRFPARSQPITNITPVRRGRSWAAWALLVVLRRVSKLTMARSLQFIHFARWQRVRARSLPRLSAEQPKEKLASDFFLFASNFNGPWDQYIDTFARIPRIRLGMWWLWRFSRGYPGPFPIRTFKEWIRYHTYPELLYYDAYPQSTVRDVAAALEVEEMLTAFVRATPDNERPADFRTRYRVLVGSVGPKLGRAPVADVSGPAPVARWRPDGSRQSSLTAMCPVEVLPAHEASDAICAFIDSLTDSPSPLARCPMLHFARLVLIDDLLPALGSQSPPALATRYLLFLADVDGPVGDFLDCLYESDRQFVEAVWGRCLGYPHHRRGPVFFRRYIERCSLPVQLPFVAFPGHSAVDIADAIRTHGELAGWMARNDDRRTDDESLQKQWHTWIGALVLPV